MVGVAGFGATIAVRVALAALHSSVLVPLPYLTVEVAAAVLMPVEAPDMVYDAQFVPEHAPPEGVQV
jgi:hypothetical protein